LEGLKEEGREWKRWKVNKSKQTWSRKIIAKLNGNVKKELCKIW